MKRAYLIRLIFITIAFFSISIFKAQTLTINEIISAPKINADKTDALLKQKGWEQYSYEINKDSGFVKRVWMIKNHYNDLKSYFSYFQSDVDSVENYITYQFSDRDAFKSYLSELKSKGYKLLAEKKKRGKKKKEKNKSKDKEYLYFSEKGYSLINVKEIFLLGFNVFLIDSYNSKSLIAKKMLEER